MANFSEVTHLEDVSRWNKCKNDRDRRTLRNAGACKHSTVSISTPHSCLRLRLSSRCRNGSSAGFQKGTKFEVVLCSHVRSGFEGLGALKSSG